MRSDEQRGGDASDDPIGSPGDSLLDAALDVFAEAEERAALGPLAEPVTSPAMSTPDRDMSVEVQFLSNSPDERREMVARLFLGLEQVDTDAAARLLVADPDAETRWMAAEALAEAGARLPLRVIQRALQDPRDRIRAAAVRLAERRGSAAFTLLIPLVGQRRWPMAQSEALDALQRLLEADGRVSERELGLLLAAVADLDPPPLRAERPALERIARARSLPRA